MMEGLHWVWCGIKSSLQIPRNREAKKYNGRIIECYWDQKTGWNFMRVREDKSHPNGYTTAKSKSVVLF